MFKCPVCNGTSYMFRGRDNVCSRCYHRDEKFIPMIEERSLSMKEIYYAGAQSVASCIKNGNFPGNAVDNLDSAIEKAKAQVESGDQEIAIVVKVVAVVKKVNPVVVEKF